MILDLHVEYFGSVMDPGLGEKVHSYPYIFETTTPILLEFLHLLRVFYLYIYILKCL